MIRLVLIIIVVVSVLAGFFALYIISRKVYGVYKQIQSDNRRRIAETVEAMFDSNETCVQIPSNQEPSNELDFKPSAPDMDLPPSYEDATRMNHQTQV